MLSKALRYLLLLVLLCAPFVSCSSGGGDGGRGEGGSNDSFALHEIAVGDGPLSVQLSWDEPVAREDGSPLTEELGYRVLIELENAEPQTVLVGHVNSVILHGLSEAEYFFSVSAIDPGGMESAESAPVGLPPLE